MSHPSSIHFSLHSRYLHCHTPPSSFKPSTYTFTYPSIHPSVRSPTRLRLETPARTRTHREQAPIIQIRRTHQEPQIMHSTLLSTRAHASRSFPSLVSNTFKARLSAALSAGPIPEEICPGNLVAIFISIFPIFSLSFSSLSFVLP